MLDGMARRAIDPALNRAGQRLARHASADQVTLAGLVFAFAAAALIAVGLPLWALLPLAVNRVLDGLDGAVARVRGKTDFGGLLDIACDFVFYAVVPLGFVLADPSRNAVAGAVLIASFYVNAASFLGYAILAGKRGMESRTRGEKSLYFTAGLMEGSETILFFVLMCLFPMGFATLALVFSALCLITAVARLRLASRVFR